MIDSCHDFMWCFHRGFFFVVVSLFISVACWSTTFIFYVTIYWIVAWDALRVSDERQALTTTGVHRVMKHLILHPRFGQTQIPKRLIRPLRCVLFDWIWTAVYHSGRKKKNAHLFCLRHAASIFRSSNNWNKHSPNNWSTKSATDICIGNGRIFSVHFLPEIEMQRCTNLLLRHPVVSCATSLL